MSSQTALLEKINERFGSLLGSAATGCDMVTLELPASDLIPVCTALRDEAPFCFEQLIDVCGVDYLEHGQDEWRTHDTTKSGYSRGYQRLSEQSNARSWDRPRFAVVYHLLSVTQNQRCRLRVFLDEEALSVPSVVSVWSAADWFEREAFDLFGIVFEGHPDLRRLLTDYGFVGHPFRKDFPLIGEVELRYDAQKKRCVYEPVSIQPRVLVPKVIRQDSRYLKED